MVQLKAKYPKIKQRYPYQDNITHGSWFTKIVINFEY
jgi:hypothetical protein